MPIKLAGGGFMASLPNLPGGNTSPDDAGPHEAGKRELEEETHGEFTVDITNYLTHTDTARERYSVRTGGVRPTTPLEQAAIVLPHHNETEPVPFTFKASELRPASNGVADIRAAVLALYLARFPLAAPTPQAVGEFNGSHTISTMATRVGADRTQYDVGLGQRRAGALVPPGIPTPQQQAAFTDYNDGLAHHRAGTFVGTRLELGYLSARTDYTDGLAHHRAGTFDPARTEPAYVSARTDYTDGLAHHRAGTFDPARTELAYVSARTDYTQGLAASEATTFDLASPVPGYDAAGTDYQAGHTAAAAGNVDPHSTRPAYVLAATSYRDGRQAVTAGAVDLVRRLASQAYLIGVVDGETEETAKRRRSPTPEPDDDSGDDSDTGTDPKRRRKVVQLHTPPSGGGGGSVVY
jgi:hypothetical protein